MFSFQSIYLRQEVIKKQLDIARDKKESHKSTEITNSITSLTSQNCQTKTPTPLPATDSRVFAVPLPVTQQPTPQVPRLPSNIVYFEVKRKRIDLIIFHF